MAEEETGSESDEMWEESSSSSSSSSEGFGLCLLCASGTKSSFPIDKPKNHHQWTHQQLFSTLCKILGMKEPSKSWDFESEKEFPFCKICKSLFNTLADVYSKLEELERVIKARMGEGEKTFVGEELYSKCDQRYLAFRKEALEEKEVVKKDTERLPNFTSLQRNNQAETDSDQDHQDQDDTNFTSGSESEEEIMPIESKSLQVLQRKGMPSSSTTKKGKKRKPTSPSSSTSSDSDSDTMEVELPSKTKKRVPKPTPPQNLKQNPNLVLYSCRLCRDKPGFSSKPLFNKHLVTIHNVSDSKKYAQMNATLANKSRDGRKRYHTEKGWVTECEICSKQFVNVSCRMSEWKHHQLTHKCETEVDETFLKNMRHGTKSTQPE